MYACVILRFSTQVNNSSYTNHPMPPNKLQKNAITIKHVVSKELDEAWAGMDTVDSSNDPIQQARREAIEAEDQRALDLERAKRNSSKG